MRAAGRWSTTQAALQEVLAGRPGGQGRPAGKVLCEQRQQEGERCPGQEHSGQKGSVCEGPGAGRGVQACAGSKQAHGWRAVVTETAVGPDLREGTTGRSHCRAAGMPGTP